MSTKDGANPPKEAPKAGFNFNMGNNEVVDLFQGLSPEDLARINKDLAEDETVEEGKENAVTEGEKADLPEVPAKTEAPPEPEQPAVEPPETSVALKFNIKRHGKEIELDLAKDPDRLKTLVALGFDYTQKTQELARERDFVAAHKKILESESFKNFLDGERSEGRLLPEQPPPVDKAALTEYALRKMDEDFDVVRERMAAVATSLGPEVEQVVDSDHNAFVRMYDRIAADVRKSKAPLLTTPAPAVPTLDAKVAERILKSKEVLIVQAQVESPGAAPEQGLEMDRWRKQDAKLSRRFRESKSDDDAIALVQHRQYMP